MLAAGHLNWWEGCIAGFPILTFDLRLPSNLLISQEVRLWGGQSWPQAAFKAAKPAESRLRAELPAPRFVRNRWI